MQKNNFIGMSINDLSKKKKYTFFATGLLIAVLIGLFGIILFKTINKGFTLLLIIPFGFLPILIMMFNQIKHINKELKNRELNL